MIKKNLAFTMSEALIVLGIVAVLATLSVIAVTNAKPDENIIMYRRAYANTLKVVQNLMADAQLYPNATTIAGNFADSKLSTPYSQRLLALWDIQDEIDSIGSVNSSNATGQYEIMCAYDQKDVPMYFENGSSYCLNGKAVCNSGWSLDSYGGACVEKKQTSSLASSLGLTTSIGLASNGNSSRALTSTSSGLTDGCVSPCTTPAVCLSSPTGMCCDPLCKPYCPNGTLSNGRCVTEPSSSSGGEDITTGSTDQDYDFSTLATSVFGKGFSDTVITAEMKTKYPYLSSATQNNKFALSFMSRLNPVSNSVNNNTVKFSTADGMYWEVVDHFNEGTPYATVTVQVDGENATACYYDSSSCPAPNKFTFYIEKSGKVHNRLGTATDSAKDPMACSYARYSNVTKNSKINTNSTTNTCFK